MKTLQSRSVARSPESLAATVVKTFVLGLATVLYLRELASGHAIIAALGAVFLAALAARWATTTRVRLPIVLATGVLFIVAGGPVEGALLASERGLGPRETLLLADAVYFSLGALGLMLILRSLAGRFAIASVLEAAYVVGSAAFTFASHREQQIAQPRWLSDWAWSQGLDPQTILFGTGIAAMVLAALMLLRSPDWAKLLASMLALLILGGIIYEIGRELRLEPDVETGLDLTSKEQDEDSDDENDGGEGSDSDSGGGGGGGGGGGSNNPFDAPSSMPEVVHPVAVANFHDEWSSDGEIMYFRQLVLSFYNGHHLVSTPQALAEFDVDVITEFPRDKPILARDTPSADFVSPLEASMYLLMDHPQPLALTASTRVAPIDNPNPRRFAAAYHVLSQRPKVDYQRLMGRRSIPDSWAQERRAHYLALPDDPRYQALSDIIVRDIDPRLAGDDIARALAIKLYLEKEGVYTLAENARHESKEDPAASFLFGSLRGWCVHFAHSAVFLLRSQGIAARVALGYAVDPRHHGSGSAVMILSDRAHAWPEIHIEGVGWIPFDIYPERSETPPPRYVDQSMEALLGELARGDETGGHAADPDAKRFAMPWALLVQGALGLLAALLVLAYLIKLERVLAAQLGGGRRAPRRIARATLDRFSDVGLVRQPGETREAFARRHAALAPSLERLTRDFLGHVLGGRQADPHALRETARAVRRELHAALPWWRRLGGWLNPLGWWWTR